MNRTTTLRLLPLAATIGLLCSAQAGASTYSYTGHLDDGGKPADGRYDLSLTAYPAEKQGATLAAPMVFEDVEVRGGQFRLEFDLPAMDAANTWLELGVRDGAAEGAFAAIPGRAKAVAAPLVGACWSTTGDTGVNPATNFLGTIDNQPFVIRTRNAQSLRIEPSSELFSANPITANVIAGSRSNAADAGVRGATIAGGGVPAGDSDPLFQDEGPNRITDHYGVVGGGYANRAGNAFGTPDDAGFATVGGGQGNAASGELSAIGGGLLNTGAGAASAIGGGIRGSTRGIASTVPGGFLNCAGADQSLAAGSRAKVRPGANPGDTSACAGLTYPGGLGDIGTFVWADSQNGDFVSTGQNQFLVRAGGGMAINTNTPTAGAALTVNGTVSMPGSQNILSFGSNLRQMINLWGGSGEYGIGVQDFTQYFRTNSDGGFAWFAGGSHTNAQGNPGAGGNRAMLLEGRGRLTVQNSNTNAAGLPGPGVRLAFAETTGPLQFTGWDIYANRSTFNAIPPGALYFGYGNVTAAVFDTNGLTRNQSGTWSTISDARLKKNIRDIESPLDTYLKLRGHWFEYTDPKAAVSRPGPRMGFVAQEVQAAVPEWISSDPEGYLSVTPTGFEALTVEAVRQLHEENAVVDDDQARRIATLEAENAALRAELERRDAAFQSRLEALEASLENRR